MENIDDCAQIEIYCCLHLYNL